MFQTTGAGTATDGDQQHHDASDDEAEFEARARLVTPQARQALDAEQRGAVRAAFTAVQRWAGLVVAAPQTLNTPPRNVLQLAAATVVNEMARRECVESAQVKRIVLVFEQAHAVMRQPPPLTLARATTPGTRLWMCAAQPPWPTTGGGALTWLGASALVERLTSGAVTGAVVLDVTDVHIGMLVEWLVEDMPIGLLVLWRGNAAALAALLLPFAEKKTPAPTKLKHAPARLFVSQLALLPPAPDGPAAWTYVHCTLVDHALVMAASAAMPT
jgi:hypothetical protein